MNGVRKGIFISHEADARLKEVCEITNLAMGKVLEMFLMTLSDEEIREIHKRWESKYQVQKELSDAVKKKLAALAPDQLARLLEEIEKNG